MTRVVRPTNRLRALSWSFAWGALWFAGIGCTVIVDPGEVSEGCPDGFKECDGACVSVEDEEYGCARTSCSPCSLSNAVERCSAEGECVVASCVGAWEDCDRNPATGCEVNIERDPNNCGGCGTECPIPEEGQAACGRADCYVRQCSEPFADCNFDFGDGCEVDTTTNRKHCGACEVSCEASEECEDGACVPMP